MISTSMAGNTTPMNMQCQDVFIVASEPDSTLVRLPTFDSRQPNLARVGFDPGLPPAPAVQTSASVTLPTFKSPSSANIAVPASSGLRRIAIDQSHSRLSDSEFEVRSPRCSLVLIVSSFKPASDIPLKQDDVAQDTSNLSRHDSLFRGEAILKSTRNRTGLGQMTAGNRGGKAQCSRSAISKKYPEISKLNAHSVITPKQALRKRLPAQRKETPTYVRSASSLGRPRISSKLITIHNPPVSTGKKNNAFQPPAPMATKTNKNPTVSRSNDWTEWVELGIQFSGFPTDVTTKDIWNVFKKEGEILTIELFDDYQGNPSGKGRVRFRSAYFSESINGLRVQY